MTRQCVVCGVPTKKACTGCLKTPYCSKNCQKKNWVLHILECDNPGREITTADRLLAKIANPAQAFHEQTSTDYGFLSLSTREDSTALYKVYHDIFNIVGIKAPMIHEWRLKGILHTALIKIYEAAGPRLDHANFVWLSQHPNLFDSDAVGLSGRERVDAVKTLLWAHIGGSEHTTLDEMEEEVAQWPEDKQLCWRFFIIVFNDCSPPVTSPSAWLAFGFCLFSDNPARQLDGPLGYPLRPLYAQLVKRCTFDEFYKAFITSSLVALMDKHGLKNERTTMPLAQEFERHLSQSPDRYSDVWGLKSFVLYPEQGRLPSLILFGFHNCGDDKEIKQLSGVYYTLFEDFDVPPSQIQDAAEKDRLFELITTLPEYHVSNTDKKFLRRVLNTENRLILSKNFKITPETINKIRSRRA
ncbi:hypothetical protein SISSUDRAFT_1001344 [Sistotremastrum suecicum HHB10207 ss-3]|uniref:MYND-type domain-containing protein n=1 Tax=Sistotremastrum suecicum HHB10207 ss-3 TaxID=1314776 RepID=A0A166FUM2_9AGAM|nr:hypothetical protein SISSUDRAFT_1001344 [Sistotremastrum suecicum HHB10207 ss-3]